MPKLEVTEFCLQNATCRGAFPISDESHKVQVYPG